MSYLRVRGSSRVALALPISLFALSPVGLASAAPPPADGAYAASSPSVTRALAVLKIDAGDYRYHLSRRHLPRGPVSMVFTNDGPHTHALQMVRLDPGRRQGEFVNVLHGFLDGTITESPPWLHGAPFGFGPISPDRSVTASIHLRQPGRYVMYDLLTGRSGRTFAKLGMVASFSVGDRQRTGSLPRADSVITGTDHTFEVPEMLAGSLVLKLRNEASVDRQFAIVQLHHGRTIKDLRAWLAGGQVGPAPGEFIANVLPIVPGRRLLLSVQLSPGQYILVDDGENGNGVPYTDLGLLTAFTVGPPDVDGVPTPTSNRPQWSG
jgi:hypothetical protein